MLLSVLLPLTSGDSQLQVDTPRLVGTLLLTQLLPLGAGLGLRQWRPSLATRLLPRANLLSKILNVTAIGLILAVQFRTFLDIRLAAFGGMFALLLASVGAGWLLGGGTRDERRTMAITTALRNVGAGMVIAAASFPGTPALTAVLAYAVIEVVGSLALALWWGRQARRLQIVTTTSSRIPNHSTSSARLREHTSS